MHAGLHRGAIPCLVALMCALHAGLQDVHSPAPDAIDMANVWGFVNMDMRLWGLQQQAPEETDNQQQYSPKQLQALLHNQQVSSVGCRHWQRAWSAILHGMPAACTLVLDRYIEFPISHSKAISMHLCPRPVPQKSSLESAPYIHHLPCNGPYCDLISAD